MRTLLVAVALVFCGTLAAQSASAWSQLYSLPEGTPLVVTTWHRAACEFARVGEDGIECVYRGGRYWVDRARIARISLARHTVAVPVGTAVGAAAGGLLFALRLSGSSSAKGADGVVGAVIGGWVGYGIGHLVRRPEGPVLYDCCLTSP